MVPLHHGRATDSSGVGSCARQAGTLQSNQDFVDPEALGAAMAALDRLPQHMPSEAEAEASAAEVLTPQALAQIDEAFSQPSVDAIVAAVGTMAAEAAADAAAHGEVGRRHHWATAASRELARASPTSLAVTHAALVRGAELPSLAECLNMEFRIAQRFMRHADFVSGVGHVLSKGAAGAPVWQQPPPTTAAQLEEWFVAGEAGELGLV